MTTRIYWINEPEIGEKLLGIMPRPRGNDWLEDEIKWLGIRSVDCLVSLLEFSEMTELGLDDEKQLCNHFGLEFINFSIPDVSLPEDETRFIELVDYLSGKIDNQNKVVIHCRMGIGRSSMLAGGIMIRRGLDERKVFDIIARHRELEVPDTEEQKDWVVRIADRIRRKL